MYTPTSTLQNLIIHLQQRGILKTKHLINAMLATDRADFVLPTDKLHAYFDTPLSIGHNATISAPHMHAFALELLKDTLLPTHKVLDIGSGSGILCVLFSKAMNDKGTVYGVEHIHELVEFSLNNIKKNNPQLIGNKLVSIIEGDGRIGLKEQAPYNCIHVGAASEEIPTALVDQLANGGKMMLPLGPAYGDQKIILVTKSLEGDVFYEELFDVGYVPLTSKKKQLHRKH